jgi:hypothetical protein
MAAQTRSGTAADEEIELFYGDCGQTRRDTAEDASGSDGALDEAEEATRPIW